MNETAKNQDPSHKKEGHQNGDSTHPRRPHLIAALIAVAAAGLMFAQTKSIGLLGHDSYPIIITSRVQSFGDLLGTFTEPLMDGRYPGKFYRPVLNLSFALDYALWALRPMGYQLTSAALFGACGFVVFLVARRMFGGAALFAPLIAELVFVFHPTMFEVVPIPARRAEMLSWIFMGLALWAQLAPRTLAMRRPAIGPIVLAGLAMGSKETAFLLPAYVFLAVALWGPAGRFGRRMARGCIAAAPMAIVLAMALAARFAVLGGLGGYPHPSHANGIIDRIPVAIAKVCTLLITPQPIIGSTTVAGLPLVGLMIAMIGLGFVLICLYAFSKSLMDQRVTIIRHELRILFFAVMWVLGLALTYAIAGRVEMWYLLLPVVGFAFAAAALAELGRRAFGGGLSIGGAGGLLLVVSLGALLSWQFEYAPWIHRYDEWQRGTQVSHIFLRRLSNRVEQTPDGHVVRGPLMPRWVRVGPKRTAVRGVAILETYSVQAWLELSYPHRKIRFISSRRGRRPAADELIILQQGLLPGYEGRGLRLGP